MPQSSEEILSILRLATVDKSRTFLTRSFALWTLTLRRENLTDMSNTVRINQGADIRLVGEPSLECVEAPQTKLYVLQAYGPEHLALVDGGRVVNLHPDIS